MLDSTGSLCLSFNSSRGSFHIIPDTERARIFTLWVDLSGAEHLQLNDYCSISDAVSAVAQQQTGCLDWDQLSPADLPIRVHNIACWSFEKNFGTSPKAACS